MKLPRNLTEREYFIEACFCDDLQLFYSEYVKQKKDRIQVFSELSNGVLGHLYWIPRNICTGCEKELTRDNIDIIMGYWHPFSWRAVHKDCAKAAKDREVHWCQSIDADCNDCKHFERIKLIGASTPASYLGNCKKFNKETIAYVNLCTRHECFEHRKGNIV